MKLTQKEELELIQAQCTLKETIEKLEKIAAFAIDTINRYENLKKVNPQFHRITMDHFLKTANLNVRCLNALKECNFNFIDEINLNEIRRIRNIGYRSSWQIRDELVRYLKIQNEKE